MWHPEFFKVVSIVKKILAFDLSLKCTGVAAVWFWGYNEIASFQTISIIPLDFTKDDFHTLGYLPSKKKITTKSGKSYYSYVKNATESPSESVKRKRDVEVRNAINAKKKKSLSIEIDKIIRTVHPTLILVERNESFNGILTTKLLAEARGILEGVAKGIPIIQYSVSEVRKKFNLASMTRDFINKIKETEKFPKDVTKSVLKDYIDTKYNIVTRNTDESDACILFDHYYETIVKNEEG